MVLSWRSAASSSSSSLHVYSGAGDGEMFFFFVENVVMKGADDANKVWELLGHLHGDAFKYFYDRFT